LKFSGESTYKGNSPEQASIKINFNNPLFELLSCQIFISTFTELNNNVMKRLKNFIPARAYILLLVLMITFAWSTERRIEETSILYNSGINLIPYPQKVSITGDDFKFGNNINIVLDRNPTESDLFAASELARRLKSEFNIPVNIRDYRSGRKIILSREGADTELGEQGYSIYVNSNQITIKALNEAGLFYGVQTLLQIIQKNSTGHYIRGMQIKDWPDTPVRAVHYDTKHHQDTRGYVEGFIRDMARYKINMLVWEWEDKLAYESYPEVGAPGAFTISEMQEFTEYAARYHIEIVPLVQGLGHVSFILKWPQHAHLREIPASNWEFCPLKEGSYELLFALWEDAIKATPGSKHIHIGSDETYELGMCPDCRKKTEEIGLSGLYHLFATRAAKHLQGLGREVMIWERPMGWARGRDGGKPIVPQEGMILTESYSYETPDFKYAKEAKSLGYPIYAYDPNPGIEHPFLPYFYRERGGEKVIGSLELSYNYLTSAMGSGLFDGMINTSWDDAGLHNQVWMLSFITSAEYSWTAAEPRLPEFTSKYFKNYYGEEVRDMEELFYLLNEGSYYYMWTLERNVWHHGAIGKTHLPDLPRTDIFEYDEFWNIRYADQVEKAGIYKSKMDQAIAICNSNMGKNINNKYDLEVFVSIAELIKHTALTYLDLSELERTIKRGHNQRFLSFANTYRELERAEEILTDNLARREKVYNDLVETWEKVRLPKGLSTPEKEFFHEQDRARHFAFRTADMSYLIYDEKLLGIEEYLEKLREYKYFFMERFMQ
jgi:hexosaminidase